MKVIMKKIKLSSRVCDLLPVFISPGEEIGVLIEQLPVTPEHIGRDCCVGVTDVRVAVDVVNRGGDVEGLAHAVS